MAEPKKKISGFNLIGKEVKFERKLKAEKTWYSSFNFVIILSITAFSAVAYAYTLYNNEALKNKKIEVANYANANVNVEDKAEIESKINILNDKFALYQEVKGQTIDASTFYNEILSVYPGLKIDRFNFRPGQSIEVQLTLPRNGYAELPKFLQVLYAKFGEVKVSQISFQNIGSTSINNNTPDSEVSTIINLTFEREEFQDGA